MSSDLHKIKEFNSLFTKYHQRFIYFANTYLSDKMIAEDIVMESFMVYWEKKENLSHNTNPPAYIFNTIKYKCLNHLRSKEIRKKAKEKIHLHNNRILKMKIATLEACDPIQLFSTETEKIINKTIKSLPEKTKEIFIRSRFKDESYKDISNSMNITVKNVEYEISKALKKLKKSLYTFLTIL